MPGEPAVKVCLTDEGCLTVIPRIAAPAPAPRRLPSRRWDWTSATPPRDATVEEDAETIVASPDPSSPKLDQIFSRSTQPHDRTANIV